jgi:DNA-binding MarR family transcriptional regulator
MAPRRDHDAAPPKAPSEGGVGGIPAPFGASRPPSGTTNFGTMLRDPAMVLSEIIAREVAAAGYGDLRPSLLAVGQHIGAGGTRVTELAERAELSKASVVAAVDELERLGYAERVADPSDGRAKLVRTTDRGRDAEVAARRAIAATREAWSKALGAERFEQLEYLLLELREMLWPDPG